jgi:WD40 repeat protein
MKHFLRPRVFLSLLAGLAVGAVLYVLPIERPRRVLPAWNASWGVYYSPDSRRLVTIHIQTDPNVPREKQGAARLWDAMTGELIAELETECDLVASVVFSPDSQRVAASNEQGDIKLWDVDTGWPLGSYRMKGWEEWRAAPRLAFSAHGRLLWHDPAKHTMRDAETGHEVFDFSQAALEQRSGTWSTGFYLIGGAQTVRVIQLATGKQVAEFPLPQPGHELRRAALTPDGQVLVAFVSPPMGARGGPIGPSPGVAFLWDRPGQAAVRFPEADPAQDFVLAADGASLAMHLQQPPQGWLDWLLRRGSDPQHAVVVYDLATGRETGIIRGGLHACFAPDGKTLAVGRVGGAVELWDLPLRKAWFVIAGGALVAAALAWLLLGRLLRRR